MNPDVVAVADWHGDEIVAMVSAAMIADHILTIRCCRNVRQELCDDKFVGDVAGVVRGYICQVVKDRRVQILPVCHVASRFLGLVNDEKR